jgi:hypothetical protein
MMETKTELIKSSLASGDWLSALRVTSRFHDRSEDTLSFKRGFDAYQNPDFYRQLGKSPDELMRNGKSGCDVCGRCGRIGQDFPRCKLPQSRGTGTRGRW